MDKYEEIKSIIEEATEEGDVEFCEFGDGISQELIDGAEKYLGYKLSDSYKWWLKNYGDGYILGEEIFTIGYSEYKSSDTDNISDIIHINNVDKRDGLLLDNMLRVCNGYDTIFYFALDKADENGEYPIYEFNNKQLYAKDFIEFLKKRILD